jgi:hypothetical protein
MDDMNTLTFNVVYTTGTVKYLELFVYTWLKWSNYSFRLIANGCSGEEVKLLNRLCEYDSRLSIEVIPTESMITHGEALNYIHALKKSDYFCFMDSDIIFTGSFPSNLFEDLRMCSALFSGTPIWSDSEEQIMSNASREIWGRYNRSENGVCLGSTYFAIYNNRILGSLMHLAGINFNQYTWQDVPERCQAVISEMGFRKEFYDTGKILNLLLLEQGEKLIYRDIEEVNHIGAMSLYHMRKIEKGFHGYLHKNIQQLSEERREVFIEKIGSTTDLNKAGALLNDDEWDIFIKLFREEEILRKKLTVTRYLTRFIHGLLNNLSLPVLPDDFGDELKVKLRIITSTVLETHKELGGNTGPKRIGIKQ